MAENNKIKLNSYIISIAICCIVLFAVIVGVCLDYVSYDDTYVTLSGKVNGKESEIWSVLGNVGFLQTVSYGIVVLAAVIVVLQIFIALLNVVILRHQQTEVNLQRTVNRWLYAVNNVCAFLLMVFGAFVLLSVYVLLGSDLEATAEDFGLSGSVNFGGAIGSWIVAACGIVGGIVILIRSRSLYGDYHERKIFQASISLALMIILIIGATTDFFVYTTNYSKIFITAAGKAYGEDFFLWDEIDGADLLTFAVYASVAAAVAAFIVQAALSFLGDGVIYKVVRIVLLALLAISVVVLCVSFAYLMFEGLFIFGQGSGAYSSLLSHKYFKCTIGFYLVVISAFLIAINVGTYGDYLFKEDKKYKQAQLNSERK